MIDIRVKRIYAPIAPEDGLRVLVDRLWPRGVAREAAALDLWAKELAPSTALRRWFGHGAARWEDFAERYRAELGARAPEIRAFRAFVRGHDRVTLLYAARDERRNHALVLARYLEHAARAG